MRHRIAALLGRTLGSGMIEGIRRRLQPARTVKAFGTGDASARIRRFARGRGQTPAKVEQSRSALGLPIMALRISPP